MAIEIFGFAVKPEISIGDIAAIAALVSSALIFWFGYSRTRKSEQNKIARELMDRINTKQLRLFEDIWNRKPEPEGSQEVKSKWIEDLAGAMEPLLSEIEYFTHLLKVKEIDDNEVIQYYGARISAILSGVKDVCKDLLDITSKWNLKGIDPLFESYSRRARYYNEDWVSYLPADTRFYLHFFTDKP